MRHCIISKPGNINRKGKRMKIFRNNLYLLKMVYASDRKRILYIFFLALISTLKNIISVMFIKVVIDCIYLSVAPCSD